MAVNSVHMHMLKHWDLIPINQKAVANTISTFYCSVKLQLLASAQVRQEVQAGMLTHVGSRRQTQESTMLVGDSHS